MDDDTQLLTTPIAKGNSLLNKLKKEMSASTRPYASPTADRWRTPYATVVDEPLARDRKSEGRRYGDGGRLAGEKRRGRRSSDVVCHDDVGVGVELAELRGPIKRSSMTPEVRELVCGQPTQYGAVQSETRHQRTFVAGSSTGTALTAGRRRTPPDGDGSRSVRWSDANPIQNGDSPVRCGTGLPSGVNEADGARPTSGATSPPEQRRDRGSNPWTIYRGRDTYFVYGTSLRALNPPTIRKSCCDWWHEMWAPYGGFRKITSAWIFASLSLLFIANILFLVAFVTNHWGVLRVVHAPGSPPGNASIEWTVPSVEVAVTPKSQNGSHFDWVWSAWNGFPDALRLVREVFGGQASPEVTEQEDKHVLNRMGNREGSEEFWNFGLWQCCRSSDGLCLGPRFEAFYMATRTLCVLSLFLMILSFAWMTGHTLEKLLDYDACTMSCLISMCYLTTISTTLAVLCFGVRWPNDFANEYDGTDPELSFSFHLAAMTIPLTLGAAICSTMDLVTGLKQIRENDKFFSDPENFTDQTMAAIPRDNISRPKGQKKKRTAQSQYLFSSDA